MQYLIVTNLIMIDLGLKVEKDAEIDGNTTVATMQASGRVDLNASNNTVNGLSVTGRLKIPLSRPDNPQPGEIWYEG